MSYDFDREISRLGTGAEKYEARKSLFGKADVEPFWVADMDLPTPAFVTEALIKRMNHSMFGYTTVQDSLYAAIQWWQQSQHGVQVGADWIRLSPSVVTSIAIAVQAMTRPGDGVVVFSPVYGPFFFVTEHNQRKVRDEPLLRDHNGQYAIDFDALAKCFKTHQPRLLLLCNPHNPGGRVWRESELRQLVALCNTHNVTMFSDEIHCDIVYAPNRHVSLLTIEDARDNCIVAHSIGKTFNTSGLNASWVMIPNKEIRQRFVNTQELSHCGSVNLTGKIALETALSPEGAEYKQALVTYLHENIRQVVSRLHTIENASVMRPEATFLTWIDLRAFGPWPTVMKRLIHEANVALSGGTFFGPAGQGWFRLNCAHPRKNLLAATDRIVNTLNGAGLR
ncbi:MAG: PatB family C-S lyase [Deltaproteobacteria bacterium]|nr:PatB family C-S lyase [Deltaproteobacteria bacterium]